jgi:virginiamycin B lyase
VTQYARLASIIAVLAAAGAALAQPQGAAPAPPPLPDGQGKAIVQQNCSMCHELGRILRAGYTREGWRQVMDRMVSMGDKLPASDQATVIAYLALHFPERGKPQAPRIAGPLKASFQEWDAPTAGSRPHDPLAARDGSLWYTGQFSNTLGRVDTKTGKVAEFKLPKANSGPHGLVEDPAGNIWFTANFAGYIGKLDPKTGKVAEYPMPDPAAKDPHTLIFDKRGIIWFTVQSANMVGRLDPRTGEIKLAKAPTPRSNPYGMALSSRGTVFFDLFGTNKLGSIDDSMTIREYPLPNPGSRPRRIAITPDDGVWYTDYSRGFIGRLDANTGKVQEWASPGGPQSQPYGVTVQGGAVWYVESNTSPNALVRFDPKTAKFQTWNIPAGGGVVRNMDVWKDGRLALAESGVNKVAAVTIR